MKHQIVDFITLNEGMRQCYKLERSLGKTNSEAVDILMSRTQAALRFLCKKEIEKQYGSMMKFQDEIEQSGGKVDLMKPIKEKIFNEQQDLLEREVTKITLARYERKPLDSLYQLFEDLSGEKIL